MGAQTQDVVDGDSTFRYWPGAVRPDDQDGSRFYAEGTPESAAAAAAAAGWEGVRGTYSGGVRLFMGTARPTGSRFDLAATPVPATAGFGADLLVSVLHPWPAVYPLQSDGGLLTLNYVAEKFCRDRPFRDVYAGDLVALVLSLGALLDRPVGW